MTDLVGQRVKILTEPCAGLAGTVTAEKRGVTGEFRVAFDPPAHVQSVGALAAVWRKTTDLEVIRERGRADA